MQLQQSQIDDDTARYGRIAAWREDIPLSAGIDAHRGTSFSPERRGEQEREGYAATLQADYETLAALADTDEKRATLEAEFARYREGLKARTLKHLASKARCLSWMITGPSNFPNARNAKRNDVEHKRSVELIDFRTRALAAIRKTLCPGLRPIMSGDADATGRLAEKIADLERSQKRMKDVNAAHKAYVKKPASLDGAALSEQDKAMVRAYVPQYSWEPHPFPPYALTNNSANIRRLKSRLESVATTQAQPETTQAGAAARLEDCPADNRVRLYFPGKPDEATRSRLKRSGFRWTPSLGCWQAYRSALAAARDIAGVA